jgi:outer membrane protein TolC
MKARLMAGILLAGLWSAEQGTAAAQLQLPETPLTLGNYLEEVKAKNGTYASAALRDTGASLLEKEADLTFSPTLFSQNELDYDQKPVFGSLYEETDSESLSLGLSQTASFGLQSKLYYAYSRNVYRAADSKTGYANGSWVLDLSVPLLQNCLGRSTRAAADATRFQAESEKWNAQYEMKNLAVKAEIAYWELAACRELVRIQQKGLEATQAICQYNRRRARMNLTDQGDLLQSQADLETKKMNLKTAQDDEASALRAFNGYRNSTPETATPVLQEIDCARIVSLTASDSHELRPDVKAAEADAKATEAAARQKEEANKPTLDAYAGYALNGGDAAGTEAVQESFSAQHPTARVGLNFSMPLDWGAAGDVREGARHKAEAARLNYEQKLKDQENTWLDLKAKQAAAKERLNMTMTIQTAQKQKLEYERERLKNGRTSTYQVLQFEQDFISAEYNRVNAAYAVLNLLSQLQYYQDSPALPASGQTGEQP